MLILQIAEASNSVCKIVGGDGLLIWVGVFGTGNGSVQLQQSVLLKV